MNFNRILNSQTKTVTFAAFLIAVSSGISGILGLIRDGLLAGNFGVWAETNPYFAAFRINDFFYNLLIVGGLSIAFLPLFAEYYARGKERAWEMTNYILNVFLSLLVLTSIFIFIFAPQLVKLVTPGFAATERSLTANLIRIMILSPIFFGFSSLFSGILQYFNRFLIYSLAPILYNLGIIFGILILSPIFGIFGVGMGVALGAASHWMVQIPIVLNCGFRYRFLFNLKYPAIKRIFYLALPRLFAITSQQINLLFITAIASTIAGGITIFNFAHNLQYLPISIFGISFAIAAFPALAKNWAQKQKKEFFESFSSIFRQIIFLILPVSFLIFLLRDQIVRLILGSFGEKGKFDWQATQLVAASFGIFSISILASALIPFISRVFFSFQDTKTPTLIAILTFVLNIILSFFLVWFLGSPNLFQSSLIEIFQLKNIEDISILGLPLAFSITAVLQIFLLLAFLYQKIGNFYQKEIFFSFFKIFFASLVLGLFLFFALRVFERFFDTRRVSGLFFQTTLTTFSGILIYCLITLFFKFPEIRIIISSLKKQFKKEETLISEIGITQI